MRPRALTTFRRRSTASARTPQRYGADAAEVGAAIVALRPPRSGGYDAVVDLGDRTVTIAYLGRRHTTSDLVVAVPATHDDDRMVVLAGDSRPAGGGRRPGGHLRPGPWKGGRRRVRPSPAGLAERAHGRPVIGPHRNTLHPNIFTTDLVQSFGS